MAEPFEFLLLVFSFHGNPPSPDSATWVSLFTPEISMRLTRASSYALHAVDYLVAQKTTDAPIPSHVIARAEGIPERFLLKALKPLVSAQILVSTMGPNGGFRLARPASAVTLLEVVEAIDGPVRGHSPLSEGDPASSLNRRLEKACVECADSVRARLGKISIADLLKKG
jgi:Rrf2 family protein